MTHDTHHHTETKGPKTPLGSAFWFVLVLVFLFIGAVNFVSVMSHDEEGHGGLEATEHATHQEGEHGSSATEATSATHTEVAAPTEAATDSTHTH